MKKKSKKKFKLGTIVKFSTKNFNAKYWKNLSEQDRIKYYGSLGYGAKKTKFFAFICELEQVPGHCVLIALDDGKLEVFRHISDFTKADIEEL